MPFVKVRRTLVRWMGGTGGISRKARRAFNIATLPAQRSSDIHQRLQSWLAELGTRKSDWFGRVRLINLDTVRQRVGYSWPKLSGKVELLTAKIIRDKLSLRDSYLRIREAEFLIVFADASPEEAKIRCLAIVEAIHEKLFGRSEQPGAGAEGVAECHIALESGASAATNRTQQKTDHRSDQEPLPRSRSLFRPEAEVLNGAAVAADMQTALDVIIRHAGESNDLGDLNPLETRLKFLARDLTALKPSIDLKERHSPRYSTVVHSLTEAEKDTTELISVIGADSGRSHDDIMEALDKLRFERVDRLAKATAGQDARFSPPGKKEPKPEKLEFVPVYRSVSQGEQLYRGLYRIDFCGQSVPGSDRWNSGSADHRYTDRQHQEMAARERALLEQAARRCHDRTARADFVLVVPVHVGTLNRPHLQRRYATILRGIDLISKRRLIINIVGYRESDDTIGMRRAVEELRVHAHAIFVSQSYGEVVNAKLAVEACKRLGAHAVGLDFSHCNESETRIIGALGRFIQLGQDHDIPTYVSGITTTASLARAIAGGISYVCAPRLIPPETTPRNFGRTNLKELFWAVS